MELARFSGALHTFLSHPVANPGCCVCVWAAPAGAGSCFTCEVLYDSCHVHRGSHPDPVLVGAFLQVAHHPPHGENHPSPAGARQLGHFLLPTPPWHLAASCFSSCCCWFSVPCSKSERCKGKPTGLRRNVFVRCCCSPSKNPNPPPMPVKVQALFVKSWIIGIFAITSLLSCTVSAAIRKQTLLSPYFSGDHKITDKQTTNPGICHSTPKRACGHSHTPLSQIMFGKVLALFTKTGLNSILIAALKA